MTINRDYTETHRVRPGRLAARLRVNVLLVISGQLLGRSVPPPPPPTPPPLLRLFLILCPSFRTPLSPSLSLSFSSTWSRFLPRCLDVRWGHRCRRARSPFNADPSSVGSAPCAARRRPRGHLFRPSSVLEPGSFSFSIVPPRFRNLHANSRINTRVFVTG